MVTSEFGEKWVYAFVGGEIKNSGFDTFNLRHKFTRTLEISSRQLDM